MLKRPTEKVWKHRQPEDPHDVFMRLPSSGLFVGPSGQGKSTTAVALLTGPYAQCFDRIHIFSPSATVDTGWQPVRDMQKRWEEVTWHDSFDAVALEEILRDQKERVAEAKASKTSKPLPASLIVLDDLADTPQVHRSHGLMATLFIRSRHLSISCWCSTQKYTNIAPVARANARWILCWKLRGEKETKALAEELSGLFPRGIHDALELYREATAEAHSFLVIDYTRPEEQRFTRSFEERLLVED